MKSLSLRLMLVFALVSLGLLPSLPAAAGKASPGLSSGTIPTLVASGGQLSPETAAPVNQNLIVNGDAETGGTSPWHGGVDDFIAAVAYGSQAYLPSLYDIGPVVRGRYLFIGNGTDQFVQEINAWQTVDISAYAQAIDTGRLRFDMSGYFGGISSYDERAYLRVYFNDVNGVGIPGSSPVVIGDVSAADRQNKSILLPRETKGIVPKGTRHLDFQLQNTSPGGTYPPSAFADNLSFVFLPMQIYLPAAINSASAAITPASTSLAAPSAVTVTPNGLTRMDITWTDNSSSELGFEVDRLGSNGIYDPICNTKAGVTDCLDIGQMPTGYILLNSNTSYTYRVRAIGSVSSSAWAYGSGTTSPAPTTPPSGTMTCQVIDVTSSQVTVVWTDPYANEKDFYIEIFIAPGDFQPLARVLEDGTSVTVINLQPGMPVQFRITPENNAGSGPSCTTPSTLIPGGGGQTISSTLFYNDASYPVISLVVDGWEQFPVRPLGILSGSYYELDELAPGTHTWKATTGFWDDTGQRFSMYNYSGQFSQPSSGSYSVHIPDMRIQDLLSVPPANLGYWEGYYFDSNANCHTAAFKFKQDGTYNFYVSNALQGSGVYSLVQYEPAIFSTKFQVNGFQGLLVETQGEFYMSNGPSSWKQITYVFKSQGYVYNPFCP